MTSRCFEAIRTCYNDNAFTENYHNGKCSCANACKLFNPMEELNDKESITPFRFIGSKVTHITYNGHHPKDLKIKAEYEKLDDITINCIITLVMTRPVGNEIKTNDDVLTMVTENTFKFNTEKDADLNNYILKVHLFGLSFPYMRSYVNVVMGCTEYPVIIGLVSPNSIVKE